MIFSMHFRKANEEDLQAIVRLLADDDLGAKRERYEEPLPDCYYKAFKAIEAQEGNQIILAIDGQTVIGCLQLTIIPGLARQGMKRAQIEGVRVDQRCRGNGVGEALFKEAIAIARSEGCGLVQLTTDKQREDAHHFYNRLGFLTSHEGMKLIF
ncbi:MULTISPECIES: GNAT family N-acetyltransferase [Cytobacillus]|uniref:GNAT family N-acetyltransferase n=1 Tax=Cytobacillus TaxID=2675230 RepID=UPI001D132F64|nr:MULTISPECIES: GNAT family N-acetyltransferase [Cytobacillus]MCC3645872.1 GNAT family N-acetyltransferase [Cytobacillus oceanisediminis]MCS0652473.1 GNAT family N-acetyltransferase [Cytobacillus firmus]